MSPPPPPPMSLASLIDDQISKSYYEKKSKPTTDEDLWKRIPIEYAIPLSQFKEEESKMTILIYLLLWETVQSMLDLQEKDPSKSKGMITALLSLLKDPRIYNPSSYSSFSNLHNTTTSSRILSLSSSISRFKTPSTSVNNLLQKSLLESKVEADGVLSRILKIYHSNNIISLSSKAIIYFTISQVVSGTIDKSPLPSPSPSPSMTIMNTNSYQKGGLRMIGLQQLLSSPTERSSQNRKSSNALGIFEWRSKNCTTPETIKETFSFYIESLSLLIDPNNDSELLRVISLTSMIRFISNHFINGSIFRNQAHLVHRHSKTLEDWINYTEELLEEIKKNNPHFSTQVDDALFELLKRRERIEIINNDGGFSLGSMMELILIMLLSIVISLILGFIKEY